MDIKSVDEDALRERGREEKREMYRTIMMSDPIRFKSISEGLSLTGFG